MPFNRREFLKNLSKTSFLSLAYLGSSCSSGSRPKSTDLILGGGQYIDLKTKKTKYVLALYDFKKSVAEQISVNFFAHGISINPRSKNTLFLFQKKGSGACEVNIKTKQVIRYMSPTNGCHFYGHGSYSKDGSLLFAVESYLNNHDGIISIRDTKSLDILGEIPSYGKSPHDCHLFNNGKLLAITNGGGTLDSTDSPSVCYVDVESGMLIEKIELPDQRINAGHLVLSKNQDLGVVSAPRSGLPGSDLGGVSFRKMGSEIINLQAPEEIKNRYVGETLSAAIHETSKTFAVTTPKGDIVSFWDTKNNQFKKHINLPRPRGITATTDGKYFIVSYGSQASLGLIATDTLELQKQASINATYITGSHIINWHRETNSFG
ncbi:MAG: DUF1513 domain-containing protein [Gammaproteobacteria bacterium]